jgi:hypothetical protein
VAVWFASAALKLVRDVTDEQRSSRPNFNATLRAAASWLFGNRPFQPGTLRSRGKLTQIPKFGIVLVLVVVLVLGALGFRDRKETDGTNLFC